MSSTKRARAFDKIRDDVFNYDKASSKLKDPSRPASQKEKVAAEVKTLTKRLQKGRTDLTEWLQDPKVEAKERRELTEFKKGIDKRLEHLDRLDEPFAKLALSDGIDPEEQSMVDVFSFIDSVIANLKAQVKKSEASIEAALSSIESATTLPEQEKRLNVFNKILGLNEDREWHIQQLGHAEELFRKDQLTAQQVMSLKNPIDKFIEAEKGQNFVTDRSVYDAIGLDTAVLKEATRAAQKAKAEVAYIHDDSGEEWDDGEGFKSVEGEQGETWEIATSKKAHRTQKDPEERKREQEQERERERERNRAEYEDEQIPVSERPPNYRTVPCREWSKNGLCSYGGSCMYAHGNLVKPKSKDSTRAKTEGKTERGKSDRSEVIEIDAVPVCFQFMNGTCRYGSRCNFLHTSEVGEFISPAKKAERSKIPCKWEQRGGCNLGENCHFHHETPAARQQVRHDDNQKGKHDNSDGKPRKEVDRKLWKTVLCAKFSTPEGCPFKSRCTYAHGTAELQPLPSVQGSPAEQATDLPSAEHDLKEDHFPHVIKVKKARATKKASAPPPVKTGPVSLVDQPVAIQQPSDVQSEDTFTYTESTSAPVVPTVTSSMPSTPALDQPSEATLTPPEPITPPPPTQAVQLPNSNKPVFSPPPNQAPLQLAVLIQTPRPLPPSVPTPTPTPSPAVPSDVQAPQAAPTPPLPLAAPAAPRFPGLLPLGPGACLNHFLKGSCANGRDCLSRHVVNSDDFACGLKPQLGPGFCLNHALAGHCFNGANCLNRHALIEDDYVSTALPVAAPPAAAPATVVPAPATTPAPAAPAARLPPAAPVQPAPPSRSSSHHSASRVDMPRDNVFSMNDPRVIQRPAQANNVAPSAPAAPEEYPAYVTRAVADLLLSDDENEEPDFEDEFEVDEED